MAEKYELEGEVQLMSFRPNENAIRVALVGQNYVDHLDIWFKRKDLAGKTVKVTVKVIEQ